MKRRRTTEFYAALILKSVFNYALSCFSISGTERYYRSPSISIKLYPHCAESTASLLCSAPTRVATITTPFCLQKITAAMLEVYCVGAIHNQIAPAACNTLRCILIVRVVGHYAQSYCFLGSDTMHSWAVMGGEGCCVLAPDWSTS